MIIINVTEQPVKERHVCYFTNQPDFYTVELFEVVEEFYKHPQCDYALLSRFNTRLIRSEKVRNREAGPILVLEAAQHALQLVQGTKAKTEEPSKSQILAEEQEVPSND